MRLLSLVGNQPAAVAVAVATWRRHYGAARELILLHSPQTEGVAERIADWAELTQAAARVAVAPFSAEIVRDLSVGGGDLVYLADAGLGFQIFETARLLPPETPTVHTFGTDVWIRRGTPGNDVWSLHPAEDLGLEVLLSLHGATFRIRDVRREETNGLPSRARSSKTLVLHGAHPDPLLAWERAGSLFFLYGCWGGRREDLQAIRAILAPVGKEFGGLRPRIGVVVRSRLWATQVRATPSAAFVRPWDDREEAASLARWFAGDSGSVWLHRYDPTGDTVASGARFEGGGASGPDLLVVLGDDPSATLTALATHAPRVAHVAFDQGSERIVELAGRLAGVASSLELGELRFVPTTVKGEGLPEAIRSLADGSRTLVVNVTPGTKAQHAAMARGTVVSPGAVCWSLDHRDGVARSLDRTADPIPLRLPSALAWATVKGGESRTRNWDRRRGDHLRFLARARAHLGACTSVNGVAGRCEHAEIARLNEGGTPSVSVRFENQRRRWNVSGRFFTANQWLEEVVAAALEAAGARDVLVGLSSLAPRDVTSLRTGMRAERSEIDVVASFDSDFVAVSCKSGERLQVAKWRREIEAVAGQVLGRFALPVLVAPKARVATGASLVLDLAVIAEPVRLAQSLREFSRGRSTRR